MSEIRLSHGQKAWVIGGATVVADAPGPLWLRVLWSLYKRVTA